MTREEIAEQFQLKYKFDGEIHRKFYLDFAEHISSIAEKQAYECCHKALLDMPSNHAIIFARQVIGKMIEDL